MTISEVSKKYNLTADTIRYYERIGLIPPVHRNSSGNRDFLEEDCNWVEFIKCMRNAGLSIEALIDYVAMFQKGKETIKSRKNLLIEQRELLVERIESMKATLERLDMKIDGYEERCLIKEQELFKGNK
ncbi:MerR family transcriptional regulator [Clostridium butyricum]|jgi:DNA-binding transcriptional MerR regulator|uniref:MerR family transcriptional regulator n=1 Tax=Clostridium butyricum TaxID=1492 RepID=UPI0003D669C9|nr:MerR family transcriptional regulator [Clostridium butyricum]ETI87566.1 MAG: MerR-family transcriptional regulator [Clostridium butyricum DORA_1]MDU1005069.1 MerR family transcriptional regulator [Clostridium butyricum]MDU1507862.1 MerR family transcriptional regulator [Clostridium butyricum]MDU4799865.1 MerR family transcriptional regulator [Clostridium butyricum]MDU5721465.1 MerR family transcriptional regulator [Clostridium butyricum]